MTSFCVSKPVDVGVSITPTFFKNVTFEVNLRLAEDGRSAAHRKPRLVTCLSETLRRGTGNQVYLPGTSNEPREYKIKINQQQK